MITTLFLNNYPLDSCSESALEILIEGRVANSRVSKAWNHHTSLVNAFLDITGRRLNVEDMRSQKTAESLLRGFEGFLIEQTKYGKRQAGKIYGEALRMLSTCFDFALESAVIRNKKSTKRYEDSIIFYSQCPKSAERLAFYSGWFLRAHTGAPRFINLAQFYKQYGKDCTDYYFNRLRAKLRKYSEASLTTYVKQLNFMAKRICATYPTAGHLEKLKDPTEVNNFMEQCFTYGLLHTIANSAKIEVFYETWARTVGIFKQTMVGSQLVAEPAHSILAPSFKTSVQSYKDKDNDYEKTLTPIPLSLKDENALQSLGDKLKGNRDYLVKICRATCAQELANYRRYRNLANKGNIISLKMAKSFPDDFTDADLCATWKKAPYVNKHILTSLNIAQEKIKEPVYTLRSKSLLPFLYLLVIYNPSITVSWFKAFELFNPHGIMTGFTQSAKGYKARSLKKRARKMQIISLDHKSTKLFKAIIKLTEEARTYLKSINSQAYRYLLLANRGGLETPSRMVNIPSWKDDSGVASFKQNLISGIPSARPDKQISAMVSRLSLKRTRGDQIVIKYFDTLSEVEAAKTAGHKRHTRALMARYIPPAIRHFLMCRWLRQFQNAILYDVMKDSDYLLRSMDFNTAEDLEMFLRNIRPDYDFKIVLNKSDEAAQTGAETDSDRIYISLNKQKLIVLLTIYEMGASAASKGIALTPAAMNWYKIACLVRIAGNLANEGLLGTACSQAAAHLLKNTQPSSDVANRLAGVIYA
ncbi:MULTISPECIES: hypothetical protein [Pseudomonas syringae group]|uniref:hypothetical protein n=1 Tax=Pseudomonas syringae group TaxID=136849 RepID=UPI0006D5FA8F|nr:hypothetical protein [Pseudomonas coronafaciens]KPX34348.1 Uncharacterized protein ALO77_01954 [Pseudomonas coronafaciens pv. garcae]RMV84476.1 hypothetical protein ALP02_02608 [Pseudomonas coronafaciens pv. garcae]